MLNKAQSIIESGVAFLGDNRILVALLIVIASILLAWLVSRLLVAVVSKAAAQSHGYLDVEAVSLLRPPVFYSIAILGAASATTALRFSAENQSTAFSVLTMLAVLVWTVFALKAIPQLLRGLSATHRAPAVVNSQTLPLFQNVANIAVVVFAIYYIFSSWHVDMTAWLASAGIVGIAIGFAAKDTLANLFSGVFILADKPFRIGDFVVLGTGERGEITHIGIRSTRMQTRDDVEVTVPNSIMGNTTIVNESGGPHAKFRLRVQVGVAYGSDIDEVRTTLLSVASDEELVCGDPEPRVRFRHFGASGLDFELLCWIDEPVLSGRVLDSLNSAVYKRFNSAGIEIPYSKQDVYVKELPLR